MGQFGSGLSSRWSPGGTGCELHSDVPAAVCPEKYSRHEVHGVVYSCRKSRTGCIVVISQCHTRRTVETAQLPNAFWERLLSSVFLTHVLHETSVGGCLVSGGIWTALRSKKILFGLLFRSWRSS